MRVCREGRCGLMQPKRFALLAGEIATVKEGTGTCPLREREAAALACCRERESGWLMIEFAEGVMASFFFINPCLLIKADWAKATGVYLSPYCRLSSLARKRAKRDDTMASCQEFFHHVTVMTARFSWKSKSEALSSQCEP